MTLIFNFPSFLKIKKSSKVVEIDSQQIQKEKIMNNLISMFFFDIRLSLLMIFFFNIQPKTQWKKNGIKTHPIIKKTSRWYKLIYLLSDSNL